MIYVMNRRMYHSYIVDEKMTHEQLVKYLNQTAGVKGGVNELQIK